VISIKSPWDGLLTKFRVTLDQNLQSVFERYQQEKASDLKAYFNDNLIPTNERTVQFKFEGLPIQNQTPADLGMDQGSVITVVLPSSCTSSTKDLFEGIGDEFQEKLMSGLVNSAPRNLVEVSDGEEEQVLLHVRLESDGSIDKFKVKKNMIFDKLYDAYSKRRGMDRKLLTLNFDGLPLSVAQTPEELDMDNEDLIDASYTGKIQAPGKVEVEISDDEETGQQVRIHVRLTSDNSIEKFQVQKDMEFKKLYEAYAKKKGVPRKKLKLEFDGLMIGDNETPEALDMDDEDLIDATIL